MKVPNQYKSSDLYDAGTDVVYNDDSKLQYAPFVYATTASGDNGGDEEGEDVMVVHVLTEDSSIVLDKNWTEIKEALDGGKFVFLAEEPVSGVTVIEYIDYASRIEQGDPPVTTYTVSARTFYDGGANYIYLSNSPTGVLTRQGGE